MQPHGTAGAISVSGDVWGTGEKSSCQHLLDQGVWRSGREQRAKGPRRRRTGYVVPGRAHADSTTVTGSPRLPADFSVPPACSRQGCQSRAKDWKSDEGRGWEFCGDLWRPRGIGRLCVASLGRRHGFGGRGGSRLSNRMLLLRMKQEYLLFELEERLPSHRAF